MADQPAAACRQAIGLCAGPTAGSATAAEAAVLTFIENQMELVGVQG